MLTSNIKTPNHQINTTGDCPGAPIKKTRINKDIEVAGRSLNYAFNEIFTPRTPPLKSWSEPICPGAPMRPIVHNNNMNFFTEHLEI